MNHPIGNTHKDKELFDEACGLLSEILSSFISIKNNDSVEYHCVMPSNIMSDYRHRLDKLRNPEVFDVQTKGETF